MGPPLFCGGNGYKSARKIACEDASMGPSLFCDGNLEVGEVSVVGIVGVLPWGLRFSATEIMRRVRYADASCAASMGPSLFSDGNSACDRKADNHNAASMGPSLFSDGNRWRRRKQIWPRSWLQWGRRYSATEICDAPPRMDRLHDASMGPSLFSDGNIVLRLSMDGGHFLLQWGRRYSATEIAILLGTAMSPGVGFNGAVAIQRRK